MTAAVRYPWIFRTAAVVYLLLGASMAWRFGFTPYDPAHRPWGVGAGLLGVVVGVFLFRRARWAIGLSAVVAALIAMSAAVAAPGMRGPVLLVFAGVAIAFGLYAALAGRVLLERRR